MQHKMFTRIATVCFFVLSPSLIPAETINFESYSGPSLFGGPAQTLNVPTSIGLVNFSGGTILQQEANLPADQTVVYGTANFNQSLGYQNPIRIVFPTAITNFFLDVYNGNTQPIEYTVADNAGNSSSFVLDDNFSSGKSLVGFAATGSIVTITAGPSSNDIPWDFSIDNVSFNEALPPSVTPEPTTILLSSLGFLAIGVTGLRKRLIRRSPSAPRS